MSAAAQIILGLGLFALLGLLGTLVYFDRNRHHGYCYACGTMDEHARRIDNTDGRVDTLNLAHARTAQTVADHERRLTAVEARPLHSTTRVEHFDMRSRFNRGAAIVGAFIGLVVGLIAVALLSEQVVTIGDTSHYIGWAVRQLPYDLILIGLSAVAFGAALGFARSIPVDQEITTTATTETEGETR